MEREEDTGTIILQAIKIRVLDFPLRKFSRNAEHTPQLSRTEHFPSVYKILGLGLQHHKKNKTEKQNLLVECGGPDLGY